jgi:glycosyltransferase involved in cell wall biosynthesis
MRFLVVSPQTAMNSLGRALSLMNVLTRLGDAEVMAFDTGPLWPGALGSSYTVGRYASYEDLATQVRDRLASGPLVLVAVKPFPRTLGWAADLRRAHDGALRLIADIDDADLSIHIELRRALSWRARRARARKDRVPGVHSPKSIRETMARDLGVADAVFVSSWALRSVLERFEGPTFRVPHARVRREVLPPTSAGERLRLGFIGTPRRHKGFDRLLAILDARPKTELHVLEDPELDLGHERLVQHPVAVPDALSRAYAHVDVGVLPQDPTADAGRLQLPAKLIDAQRFGRPVVATATPPILELGGPGLIPIDDWSDMRAGLAAIDRLADPVLRHVMGRQANAAFNEISSAEALADMLQPALVQTLQLDGSGAPR